jgi:hypothetical protein
VMANINWSDSKPRARPAADYFTRKARPIFSGGTLIVPIKRRSAADLSGANPNSG